MKRSINTVILLLFSVSFMYGINGTPWVDAGEDITMCESDGMVAVEAQAANFSFIEWSTTGDGFFMLPNELSTYYYPGPDDIEVGVLIIFISVLTNDNLSLTDSLTLIIVRAPLSQTDQEAFLCESDSLQVFGQSHFSTFQTWTTTGDGYFSNPFMLDPVYYPGFNDLLSGMVDLCLISFPIQPCFQPDVSCLTLEIQKNTQVQTGEDALICKNENYQLDATVQNYISLQWFTSGDGTFSNQTIQDPVYTPGVGDKAAGEASLTLMSTSMFPCQGFELDTLVLNIVNLPQVQAGINQTVCNNQIVSLSGTTAFCSGILWTTYGDGSFDNDTILNPVYYPGDNDLINGWIFLELNAFPILPCTGTVGSYLFIDIENMPVVNAGEDITICSDSIILNASVENFEEIIWTTNGDGSFSDLTSLTPLYFMGPVDIAVGGVHLTIAASSVLPCIGYVTDEIDVTTDIPHILSPSLCDTAIYIGEDLTLHFAVESFIPGTYYWYFNGIEIPDEHSPELIIESAQPSDAGHYFCMYLNSCTEVRSDSCLVKIQETFNQEFSLPEGWSGISSFVFPENSNLDSLFNTILGDIVLISDNSGIFWPEQNMNTLGTWEIPHGYQIKLEAPCSMIMEGKIEYPVQGISIPPGWSILPVNFNEIVNLSWLFDTTPGIEIIKELAGIKLFWPAMNINTLNDLIPGKAYLVFNKTQDTITVNFSVTGY